MKACLNCKNDFDAKRPHAKFCSDKCRVAYNRANPSQSVSKFQMQSLYNAFLEAVDRLHWAKATPDSFDGRKAAPTQLDDYFTNLADTAPESMKASARALEAEIHRNILNDAEFLTPKAKKEIKNIKIADFGKPTNILKPREQPEANFSVNTQSGKESILEQISAIRAEKIPKERDTVIGRKAWQMEQNNRIENLKNQLND